MKTWSIVVVLEANKPASRIKVMAETCQILYGAVVFEDSNGLVKAFAPGCWASVEIENS